MIFHLNEVENIIADNMLPYKYIDLKMIKEDTFNEVSILKMVIELFIEGVDEYIDVLNEDLKSKNWHSLFMATHKIKPNISMFGITTLEPVILELESKFKSEQNLENINGLVNSSIHIFKQVKLELHTELKSLDNE